MKQLTDLLLKEDPQWWRNLKQDSKCFIAIRPNSNCIQAYFAGGCLAKIKVFRGALSIRVNGKYVLQALHCPDAYITLKQDMGIPKKVREALDDWRFGDRLPAIKEAAHRYAGPEKQLIQTGIIEKNPNIINLEVACQNAGEDDESAAPENSRLDFAAVRKDENEKLTIVHYEAKILDDPRLKPQKGKPEPEILQQMRDYDRILGDKRWRDALKQRYVEIAIAMLKLGLTGRHGRGVTTYNLTEEELAKIAQGDFVLASKAKLVIFARTNERLHDQKIEFLKNKLEPGTVLACGESKAGGISK